MLLFFFHLFSFLRIECNTVTAREDEVCETEHVLQGWILCGVWCGVVGGNVVSYTTHFDLSGNRAGTYRHFAVAVLTLHRRVQYADRSSEES